VSSRKFQAFAIAFASVVAIGVVASAVSSADDNKPTTTATPTPKPNDPPKAEGDSNPQPEPVKATPIQEFKACVEEGGTPTENAAVRHVVKLTGMDDWNGFLDNPKVWTDWKGGILEHGADANLIASAFADCYKSDNGLVTVYTSDGHVAGNGKF
jgi:hypothetical protein